MKKSIWQRLAALGVAAYLLSFSPAAFAQSEDVTMRAEAALEDLIQELRDEDIDNAPCGSPPRAPSRVGNKAGRRFARAVEDWDRCQGSHIRDLQDQVEDYQYQLDAILIDLPDDNRQAHRALRTIELFNQRVERAQERAESDYDRLNQAQDEYADMVDTEIRKARWAEIERDREISDQCMMETTMNPGSSYYNCLQRRKHNAGHGYADVSPYNYYDTHNYYSGYGSSYMTYRGRRIYISPGYN